MAAREGEPLLVGVDIGGTKVAAGLVSPDGTIVKQTRAAMSASGTAQAGLASAETAITSLLQGETGAAIGRIGVVCPGPLDPTSGVVINPPNLPCWRNYPLAAELQRVYGVPAKLENDANAAGLAEALWGGGRGYASVFYVCIGTGIGTGLILDGKIYNGRTGAAPEGGHVSIDYRGPRCGCGKMGCIEALASGTAIAARARERAAQDGGSRLWAGAGGSETITAESVVQAWREGDPLATNVLRESAHSLTIWMGNMIDLLEPEVIVIGGGMGRVFSEWLPEIRKELPDWCVNSRALEIPMVTAKYGADSGIAGAAALCLQAA